MKEKIVKNRLVILLEDTVFLGNGSLYDEISSMILKHNIKKIAFDLSSLDYIDDLSMNTIIKLIERYTLKGYSFSFLNPGKTLLKSIVFKDITSRVMMEFDHPPEGNTEK